MLKSSCNVLFQDQFAFIIFIWKMKKTGTNIVKSCEICYFILWICHTEFQKVFFKKYFFFSPKKHLGVMGKHWIFRKWDSAVQRVQMFWSSMPENSKILLDTMKATLPWKTFTMGRGSKLSAPFKINVPVQGKGVMFEVSLTSYQDGNFIICFSDPSARITLVTAQCLMKMIK